MNYMNIRTQSIVIVDDNTAAADALARLLGAIGFEAYARYSAEDALHRLPEDNPGLMLIDIGMPGMDGYELVAELRVRGFDAIPKVALTGYGLAEDKERARAAGFVQHLTKPIGLAELRSVVTYLKTSDTAKEEEATRL